MKIKLITFTILSFMLMSCGTSKKKEVDPADIQDITWELTHLDGEEVSFPQEMRKPVDLILSSEENRVNGFAGCNNFMGGYSLKDNNGIEFTGMASTRMACPESGFDEGGFLQLFEEVQTYDLKEDQLVLKDENDKALAKFKKTAETASETDNNLTEKHWKLITLQGEKVEMADNQEKEQYFILKTDENRVEGFSGCNNFGGSYSFDEEKNSIEFSQMAGTLKACPDVEVDEHAFLKIFGDVKNYDLEGDSLSLLDEDNEVVAEFEAVYF